MEAVCDILEQLVSEGVLSNYALGGATAAGLHGEPLATRDVDVFAFLPGSGTTPMISLSPIYSRLAELGFGEFEEEGILIHGYPVQFLSASPGLETEAVASAMVLHWDHHTVRIMKPEYLATIALTVGRPKDRARVLYLLELPAFNQSIFHEILGRHDLIDKWRQWAVALGLEM
jgi:hypothetical protein